MLQKLAEFATRGIRVFTLQVLSTSSPPNEPQVRRWTRQEYYQMGDLGWFQDQRVELIDGEILQLNPQKHPHAVALALVAEALRASFGQGFWIRDQLPLRLTPTSEPEPDLAVVKGTPRDYSDHPTTALLVVEVSDTTLDFDRHDKASLCASAAVADDWIVNLLNRQLEVDRKPAADETQPHGFGYTDKMIVTPSESLAPLAAAQRPLSVAQMLP